MPRRAPPKQQPQPGLLLFLMTAAAVLATAAAAAESLPPGPSTCPQAAEACAPPCAPNSTTQCLHYLQESHKDEVCSREMPPGRRRDAFAALRLRHCCERRVDRALPESAFHGGPECHRLLQDLLDADDDAARASCAHTYLLRRYDCAQNYSIVHHCWDCKVVYRRWVCGHLIPFFARDGKTKVLPCLSLCQDVEQQCPYLLPDQTLTPSEAAHPTPQYAGEPNFLCLDPNIPLLARPHHATTGKEDCCYTHCGTPGRGANDEPAAHHRGGPVDVCEHCPGRPPTTNITTSLSPSVGDTRGTTPSSAVPRTINKVWNLLLITALLTLRNNRKQFADLLKCLIECATSVRTVPEC
ncbi:uncharacterized protein LOC132696486 [Cylas formicarius]|uniref:uncharacterized protein LOC132696486 n=1 Tax=Cylas formicarius TaxID=197179 RepID=UPI002958905A|nr:uncharacterized protein LOC132696486 [Cylas formicarius]